MIKLLLLSLLVVTASSGLSVTKEEPQSLLAPPTYNFAYRNTLDYDGFSMYNASDNDLVAFNYFEPVVYSRILASAPHTVGTYRYDASIIPTFANWGDFEIKITIFSDDDWFMFLGDDKYAPNYDEEHIYGTDLNNAITMSIEIINSSRVDMTMYTDNSHNTTYDPPMLIQYGTISGGLLSTANTVIDSSVMNSYFVKTRSRMKITYKGLSTASVYTLSALYFSVNIVDESDYQEGYIDGLVNGNSLGYEDGFGDGYNSGLGDGAVLNDGEIYDQGYLDGSTDSFMANIHVWIVPAIIIVIILAGFIGLMVQKRRES